MRTFSAGITAVVGTGTDAYDARVNLQLANKTANGTSIGGVNWTTSTTNIEVNGTGTGGLRVEGPTANLFPDFLSTARLNGLTGSGGTFTIAPSDDGATVAAAPTAASTVRLGVGSSGAGSVAVTLGAAANDLNYWAGLVVIGSSGGGSTVATLAANQTLATTTVAGGTLLINGGVILTSATTSNVAADGGVAAQNSGALSAVHE